MGFKSEADFKQFILYNCTDCFWASFSFNEINASQLIYNYTWRVNNQFIGDQENGPHAQRLWDPIIAENMVEYATTLYLSQNPDVKIIRGTNVSSIIASIQGRKFPDIPYYDPYQIYNKIGSGAPVVLGLSCIFSFFAFTYQIVSDKQMKLR